MDVILKKAKQDIRAFWPNYSDERLAWLLAHARSGKLAFFSCCCFIGVATADHALRGFGEGVETAGSHLTTARNLNLGMEAEDGFVRLCNSKEAHKLEPRELDCVRRRRIIPMIKAEMRRRERARNNIEPATALAGVLT